MIIFISSVCTWFIIQTKNIGKAYVRLVLNEVYAYYSSRKRISKKSYEGETAGFGLKLCINNYLRVGMDSKHSFDIEIGAIQIQTMS